MSQPTRILIGLVLGLALGIGAAAIGWADALLPVSSPIGHVWLNALKMTIIPLVMALLVTGVAATAEAASAGRIAARSIVTFIAFLWCFSALAALVVPALLDLWPLAPDAAQGLQSALATAKPVGEVAPFSEFLVAIVPTNAIAAAANDSFLPFIVFTLVFAFALMRLPAEQRQRLIDLFEALRDTMLVMIGWILWIAPLGVFALAFTVGAQAGVSAFGALIHYILIVSSVGVLILLLGYPVAMLGGRVPLVRFARAVAPAQAVALSTESSLASLPAMLRGAEALGIPVATSGVVLPLATAIFRATSPAMNLAVAIYVAHWFGIELDTRTLLTGLAVAAITTMGSVSLPGQISFVASIAPICIAMGVPIAPLGLLVAVETLPDIVRTIGNVTMDVAVTATVAARGPQPERDEGDALLEGDGR
jgi:Na+/H+-dicarboxylate symporter